MKTPWLSPPHVAPTLLETPRLRLRPLTINDAVRDYDAVMSSRAELWESFGPGSGWPEETLSLEQDIIDLAWHQARSTHDDMRHLISGTGCFEPAQRARALKEFQLNLSFAYTVETLDATRILGCVYFFPPEKAGFEAQAFYWARTSERASGLDAHLGETVRAWLTSGAWPWKKVAFPGRDIPWAEWAKLPPA